MSCLCHLVPILKNLIHNAKDKTVRLLRGKTVDCICTIGAAVGKSAFAADALEVMQEMMSTQICQADDPQIVFLETGFVKIAECLGQEFAQFLPTIIHPTLQRAATKPEVQDVDISERNDLPDGWDMMTIGDVFVGVNTQQIIDKTTAITVLSSYAASLEGAFYPFIESVLKVVLPELKSVYHESVRKAAYDILPQLMISAKAAPEVNSTDLQRLLNHIFDAIMDALPNETDNETVAAGIESLYSCIYVTKQPVLNETQLDAVAKLLAQFLVGWQQEMSGHLDDDDDDDEDDSDKEEEQNGAKEAGESVDSSGAKVDDDEIIDLDDDECIEDVELDMLELVIDSICDAIEKIVEYHKDLFMSPFQKHLSGPVMKLVRPEAGATENQYGLCVLGIMAQHVSSSYMSAMTGIIPIMLSHCADKVSPCSRMACFGIGSCAESFGSYFGPFVLDSLTQLAAVIARGKDSDVAVSAVGKILRYHAASVPGFQDVLVKWLSALPLSSNNASEARRSHTLLIDFCELYPDILASPHNTKILSILGAIVGTPLLDKHATQRTKVVLQRLSQLVPQSAFAMLPENHRNAIQTFMTQAQQPTSQSKASVPLSPVSHV